MAFGVPTTTTTKPVSLVGGATKHLFSAFNVGKLLGAFPWKLIEQLVKLVVYVALPCAVLYAIIFLVRLRRGPHGRPLR